MNKNLLAAALSLSLGLVPAALTTAFAAPAPLQVSASASSGDLSYPALHTESSWMVIDVPVADLGGALAGDLSLDAGTLDAGTTITLDRVTRDGDRVRLHVTASNDGHGPR